MHHEEDLPGETTPGRDRGMLTDADRDFLRAGGDLDMSRQAKSERRKELRDRVYNAILDFSLLAEYLDGDTIDEIFTRGERDLEAVRRGFQDLHTFTYAAARRAGVLGRVGQGYEFHAKRGIERAELKYFNRQSTADIEIDSAPIVDQQVVFEHLAAGEYDRLSEQELMWVVKSLVLNGAGEDELRELLGSRDAESDEE